VAGLLAFVLASSCGAERAAAPTSVAGSGTVVEESRAVPEFSSVVIEGDAVVHVDVGVGDRVVIEADDNLLEHLTTVVDAGRLVLAVEDGVDISPVWHAISTPGSRARAASTPAC
jgi:hypothetical protein